MESMNRFRLFNAIVVSMLVAGIVLVALAVATVKTMDRRVIEAAAARNRHSEFLLAASVISQDIDRPEDLRNTKLMKTILADIQQLRPSIQALEILEIVGGSSMAVVRTDESQPAKELSETDLQDLLSNKVLSRFDVSDRDRAWVFTVPIVSGETIIGALRGRFSVSKYDQLIEEQEEVAKQVAVGAVIFTSLTMLLLIRIQLHLPIARLLGAMEQVRSGNLALEAPLSGPWEIRRLAENFNQMIAQLHLVISEKERLMTEIQGWNESLESRVARAVVELEHEKDKVAVAQLAAQRNSNLAALGEVSAIMAHELGNPLNVLDGRIQMMRKSSLPDDSLRHLDVIKMQATRMSDVIEHILKSTRIEVEASSVNINDVICEVLTLLQAPGIKVVTSLSSHLPPVASNRTLLYGVILNLVSNAVQAMKNNGELRLTTYLAEKPEIDGYMLVQSMSFVQPMVRLVVQDSGIGIPDHMLDKICAPFFTTRQQEGGTGLGLAICRRVVASSGGQFAVKSTTGKGTTFILDLPKWMG
jgi:two-component system NtrC family sensor kinase